MVLWIIALIIMMKVTRGGRWEQNFILITLVMDSVLFDYLRTLPPFSRGFSWNKVIQFYEDVKPEKYLHLFQDINCFLQMFDLTKMGAPAKSRKNLISRYCDLLLYGTFSFRSCFHKLISMIMKSHSLKSKHCFRFALKGWTWKL